MVKNCAPVRSRRLQHVADRRRFRGLHVLADPASAVQARPRQRVRTGRLRRRAHQNDLLDVEQQQLFHQPNETAGAIAQAMRFAAPVAVRGVVNRVRFGDDGNRHRGGDGIRKMIPADAGQIEHLRPPGVGFGRRRPPDHLAPPPFAHQGEHDVAWRCRGRAPHSTISRKPGWPRFSVSSSV